MLGVLKARFGERSSTAAAVRDQHGRGESVYDVAPPEAVLIDQSTDDVAIVGLQADAHGAPVIPFAVGASLRGPLRAVQDRTSIDVSRMNLIVKCMGDSNAVGRG
jgi:D-lactate dehydrogenase (cytochrome)